MDAVLLALRILAGGLLLAFLGAVFLMLWRDFQAATAAAGEPGRRRGRLVVVGMGAAARLGASYALLPLTTLGRAPTNTIVLDDSFCSQEHALVTRRDGQWWLEDRDSSNGTRLNGQPVREPVVLSSGDVIGVGRSELRVELD
ncbi:MAG: FHA domain-containing protein [Anaerolineae bacterium]|nr:FHA domain-containing protein [Anaerolineae bacterium]MEB2287848.1 FHA domain-containing protein [Anaerolineae bacterium]